MRIASARSLPRLGLLSLGLLSLGTSVGCGSSSSTPTTEKVLGNYKSTAAGLISQVNFEADGTHYSMRRAVCAGSENSCIERGTYSLSSDYSTVAFTNEKTNDVNTLPFHATGSGPASSLSSTRLRVLGTSLGGSTGTNLGGSGSGGTALGGEAGTPILSGDGGVGVCLGGGDGGALTVGVNISLIFSFTLGSQSFSGGVTISLGGGSGGCPTDGGAGNGGEGGGGGGNGGGGGSDAGAGGGNDATTNPGGGDAGLDGADSSVDSSTDGDASDAGSSALYVPQVKNNGGPVLASPQIVTITYTGDSHRPVYEEFGDLIGASTYWQATTAEYGVGPATSGTTNHVELAQTAPVSLSDQDIQTFVAAQAGSTSSGWPAPNGNIVYVLYLPGTTNLTIGGSPACGGPGTGYTGGYHAAVEIDGASIAYAVVTNCTSQSATLTTILQAASHELVEAVTDPQILTNPAYLGFGDAYLAWDIMQGFQDEVGDACEFYPESETKISFNNSATVFPVQRMWTNNGAAAGGALCVPASPGSTPYYNVNPQNLQTVTVGSPALDFNYQTPNTPIQTLGYNIPVGKSLTFQVKYYSSGTTSGPWTLFGAEGIPSEISGAAPTSGHLTVSIDKTSGNDGDIANVTVSVLSADTPNYELLTLASNLGSETHFMPILISNNN